MKLRTTGGIGLWIVSLLWIAGSANAGEVTAPPTAPPVFFDDFSYRDVAGLAGGGWTIRSEAGHPGIAGALWGSEAFDIVGDPENSANRFLRLQADTDGTPTGTRQAQICHARKYLEGTFAARVRFSDEPVKGADGDVVVQSFYLVSPLRFSFDPEFSEVDWEYLPNGGWGDTRTRLYGITWQTVQVEPWKAYNQSHEVFRPLGGWHVLMMQVAQGSTRHFLDGKLLATHGGRNYPVVPMSLNFNVWFSPGGALAGVNSKRSYQQDVDWVFHAKDQAISPDEVSMAVAALRKDRVSALDTVPPLTQPLPSSCNF